MKMAMGQFCSLRMVTEYKKLFYAPAAENYNRLVSDNFRQAGLLSAQLKRLKALWPQIRIEAPERDRRGAYRVGDSMQVQAKIHLGEIKPEEVDVELYYGVFKDLDSLAESRVEPMGVSAELGDNSYQYSCALNCEHSGRFGFSVRVVPNGDAWLKFTPGLITWSAE